MMQGMCQQPTTCTKLPPQMDRTDRLVIEASVSKLEQNFVTDLGQLAWTWLGDRVQLNQLSHELAYLLGPTLLWIFESTAETTDFGCAQSKSTTHMVTRARDACLMS